MVAAANPGPSIDVGPELDLVKAALLYGDSVTVISPVTTMLLRAEKLEHFAPPQQLELVRRLVPVLVPPDQLPEFERGLAQLDQVLRSTPRAGFAQRALWEKLHELLEPSWRGVTETVQETIAQAGLDQLDRARREGRVRIESADPGDELDLLVSCIVSAKLAQTGQRQDDPHTDQVAKRFVDKLAKHLSSGKEYLIFDEQIASLTDAAIREGIFIPAKGPSGHCSQAMTASGLMGRLPTFPAATVDEVLDIRSELAPALTRFRGAMVTVSKTFNSSPWESSFEDEVHDAWVETVHPAIEDIENSVRENRSLLTSTADYAGAFKTAWPGLLIAAAGLFGHVDAAAAAGGVISGAVPLLPVLRDRRSARNDIRMQPFYFLYRAERSLQ